jgi:hypothetical protein
MFFILGFQLGILLAAGAEGLPGFTKLIKDVSQLPPLVHLDAYEFTRHPPEVHDPVVGERAPQGNKAEGHAELERLHSLPRG